MEILNDFKNLVYCMGGVAVLIVIRFAVEQLTGI